jgi:mutual gliding-motility protein MglA
MKEAERRARSDDRAEVACTQAIVTAKELTEPQSRLKLRSRQMPTYNYKSRELIAKVVYYGPGRCGKTTNLQQIHAKMRPETRSELLSVATETDRTIYFDLLPLNLGTISGMKFMVRLFTVPGQVYYAETRKLVLRGADGVVFVADSQDHMLDENRQSLRDLKDNLAANGIDYATMPLVLQYNKRDLPRLVSEAELDSALNDRGVKAISAIASDGTGVLETLRFVTLSVFNHIKAGGKVEGPRAPSVAVPSAVPTSSFGGGGSGSAPRETIQGSPLGGGPAPFGASMPNARPTTPPYGSNAVASSPPMPSFGGTASGIPPAPLMGQGGALQRALATAAAAAAPVQRGVPGAPATVTGSPISPPTSGTLSGLPAANAPRATARPASATLNPPPAGRQPPPPPAATNPPTRGTLSGVANPNGPQPVRIGADMVLDEFKNLAVMHSQMAERLAAVEQELNRLGRENQEIRELLARQDHH